MEPTATPVPQSPRRTGGLPPRPAGLATRLELGMANAPDAVSSMTATAPFGYRYQYLAGGPTDGWTTWEGGALVPQYIRESAAVGMVPVFSYYVLLQSSLGSGSEAERLYRALGDRAIMRDYFMRLRTFFEQANVAGGAVVLHVEPDFWAHMQQRGSPSDVRASVESTGLPELKGLPDSVAGFALAVKVLRDRYAPNVLLGYHLNSWGNGDDFLYSDPAGAAVDAASEDALQFYLGLGTAFDLVFAEFSDRDAGFKAVQDGDRGASWFEAADFQRHARFISRFVHGSGLRAVLWQIPYGNTRMRALNNTWNHYQDNRVEWLLDDGPREHLKTYVEAGVIALLFGRGADGATDASDASGDGVTNPAPVSGNIAVSLSADDDGGLFRSLASAYYLAGPLTLP